VSSSVQVVAGRVVGFDGDVGLGEVESDDGTRYRFHCIEIADGTRTIEVGTAVEFTTLAKFGRYEAAAIRRR
jgi:cold shock CspA family protein